MKKTTISISFDEEKISALTMYLGQKNLKIEDELEKALDVLYSKNVPAGVREFINMKTGNDTANAPKQRKPKTSFSSAVGAPAPVSNESETASE